MNKTRSEIGRVGRRMSVYMSRNMMIDRRGEVTGGVVNSVISKVKGKTPKLCSDMHVTIQYSPL